MKPLSNEHGWQLSSAELRERLGLKPGCHLPPNGLPAQLVDGIPVYVKSDSQSLGRKHRVMAICTCGAHIPAGRMHQHLNGPQHTIILRS